MSEKEEKSIGKQFIDTNKGLDELLCKEEHKRDYSRTTLNDLLIAANVKIDLLKIQLDEIENILRKIGYMKVELEKE